MSIYRDAKRPNWIQALRSAGYQTSLFGKAHLHGHEGDLRPYEPWFGELGIDVVDEVDGPRGLVDNICHLTARWDELGLWDAYRQDFEQGFLANPHLVRPSSVGLEEYYDVYVPQRAKEFLANCDDAQPFFCWVSFPGPHEPYDTPEPYASMYDPCDMPPAIDRTADQGDGAKNLLHELMGESNVHNPGLAPDEIAALRANYAGAVSLIDDQIGELIQVLQDRGLYDNTVILLTSDHGEMNGDHALFRKGVFLDAAIRIPLIVRMRPAIGGLAPKNRLDALVELIDIGPTLADIAGCELTFETGGKSLVPILRGYETKHRDYVLSEFRGEHMIVTQEWKAIFNHDDELSIFFHRPTDPMEQNNLMGCTALPPEFENFVRPQAQRFASARLTL